MTDTGTGKIDINLADVRTLTQLPGVSKTVAGRLTGQSVHLANSLQRVRTRRLAPPLFDFVPTKRPAF